MDKIRALVVDDEEPGRTRVVDLLEKDAEVEIAGAVSDGRQAVEMLKSAGIDILFLDVQMPVLDGFGVVREINPDRMPVTVFVTAFDNFAIQAFEAHAIDYLLKPFSDERFEGALQRGKEYVRNRAAGNLNLRLARLLEDSVGNQAFLDKIILKRAGRVTFLEVADIDWIEAEGVYVNLHIGPKKYLYRATLGQIQQKLNPAQFVRVNRSVAVNTSRIKELQQASHGTYLVVLKDGVELTLTKGFRPDVEDWLKQSL